MSSSSSSDSSSASTVPYDDQDDTMPALIPVARPVMVPPKRPPPLLRVVMQDDDDDDDEDDDNAAATDRATLAAVFASQLQSQGQAVDAVRMPSALPVRLPTFWHACTGTCCPGCQLSWEMGPILASFSSAALTAFRVL